MSPHLSAHLNDDELIALLYGLGDPDGHLAACAECTERWDAMRRALGMVRAASTGAGEISGRMLAAQREQILNRVARPAARSWSWIPVAAAASLLAVTLFFNRASFTERPAPPPPSAVKAESDAELLTDVYSMEQDVEPRAAAPIRGLFQEAQNQ